MNWVNLFVVIIIASALYILDRSLFFTVFLSIVQFMVKPVKDKTFLRKIPVVSIDLEFSNIALVLITYYGGWQYGLIFVIMSQIIHVVHFEVGGFAQVMDYSQRHAVLVMLTYIFSGLPVFEVIPLAIISAKIFGMFFSKIVLGGRFLSPGTLNELIVIGLYAIVFGLA